MKHHQCPENGDNAASSSTHLTHLDQRADSDRQDDTASPSRRQFLAAAGMLTAATMAASMVGFVSPTEAASTGAGAHPSTHASPQSRRARALDIRRKAAIVSITPENFLSRSIMATRGNTRPAWPIIARRCRIMRSAKSIRTPIGRCCRRSIAARPPRLRRSRWVARPDSPIRKPPSLSNLRVPIHTH